MNQRIAELPWTDEQWNRVCKTVSEEAQRTRVAAKFLPIYGPVAAHEVAVPNIGLDVDKDRLVVSSLPETTLATISAFVHLRNHEAADPELQAALTMFRRAANLIARTEDALMFNGQQGPHERPRKAPDGPISVTGGRKQNGLVGRTPGKPVTGSLGVPVYSPGDPGPHGSNLAAIGRELIGKIVQAIGDLEAAGYGPPFACVLDGTLYQAANTPAESLISPRQTIVPLLQDGPLLRSSVLSRGWGLVVSYESGQVEQVLASDISVKFLQVSTEPRFVFRVSERVALRVRDRKAVVNLHPQ